jgi:hypothetical protein
MYEVNIPYLKSISQKLKYFFFLFFPFAYELSQMGFFKRGFYRVVLFILFNTVPSATPQFPAVSEDADIET